jgi:hypothetical protein
VDDHHAFLTLTLLKNVEGGADDHRAFITSTLLKNFEDSADDHRAFLTSTFLKKFGEHHRRCHIAQQMHPPTIDTVFTNNMCAL